MFHHKRIWITWEDHRRSRELANNFNAKYIYTHAKLPDGLSHFIDIINTVIIIIREKPQILFVQNPSIVLAAISGLLKKVFGYKLIVDRHTNFRIGKEDRTPRDYVYKIISDSSLKSADITIVTNNFLKSFLEKRGGTGFVLPDRIPDLSAKGGMKLRGKHNIAFICTFADDEPFLEVIKAAMKLEDDTYIYITGNYKKHIKKLPDNIPKNIIFTGFLPEQDYIDLLFSVNIIMDFTDLDWCLVCGGYEAMAVEKAFITSDKKALRDFYPMGTVFTDHTPNKISNAIGHGLTEQLKLQNGIKILKNKIALEWENKFKEMNKILNKL